MYPRLLLATLLTAPLAAQSIDLPATVDSTLDFWGGVVSSDRASFNQMWAGSSGIAPSATEPRFSERFFERFGAFMRFDLSGVSAEMVNDPGFQATLDIVFHGFAADRNVFEGAGATTPPEFLHHAGDGKTDLLVHALVTDHATNANRWLANSQSGSLLNWDGTVPTNISQATSEEGSFRPANYEAAPRASTTIIHGWSASPAVLGATLPNQYGELTWDITSLVRDWVNGDLPNYGLMVCSDPTTSYGEQVNFLTMESIDRPPDIVEPGDATPMLRLAVIDLPPVAAPFRVTTRIEGGALRLEFLSTEGVVYRVQRSTTLAPGSWTTVGSPMTGTGNTIEMVGGELPSSPSGVFFRIEANNE